jgi:hypothetical protein
MKHEAIETMLNCLGRELFSAKEKVTVDLLGSAALVLGYQCWPNANDIDARWNKDDSFVLGPLITDIGKKRNHLKGAHWMNSDISDIIYHEGTWARTVAYGYLNVRIPTPEFMMSILVGALHTCEPGNALYPPFGKTAAQCQALASSQGWGREDIVRNVGPFFPHGIPPTCDEWLVRIFAVAPVSSKKQEMVEPQEKCDILMIRG